MKQGFLENGKDTKVNGGHGLEVNKVRTLLMASYLNLQKHEDLGLAQHALEFPCKLYYSVLPKDLPCAIIEIQMSMAKLSAREKNLHNYQMSSLEFLGYLSLENPTLLVAQRRSNGAISNNLFLTNP